MLGLQKRKLQIPKTQRPGNWLAPGHQLRQIQLTNMFCFEKNGRAQNFLNTNNQHLKVCDVNNGKF